MRNSMLYQTADMECITRDTTPCNIPYFQRDAHASQEKEDMFATVPMIALHPTSQQTDEEELYTSFEQAISDRARTVSLQLGRLSGSVQNIYYGLRTTDALTPYQTRASRRGLFDVSGHEWRRGLLWLCGALMLVLLGFDLMGLLVLLR